VAARGRCDHATPLGRAPGLEGEVTRVRVGKLDPAAHALGLRVVLSGGPGIVDSVQIVLFGVACGVGTDPVGQEPLTFLHALQDVESDRGAVHRFARWRLPPRV
jgi:hypothetical protein